MTHPDFLSIFKKHLRVAEPQRASILAEMEHHLSELEAGADPVQKLGDPRVLAAAENRTHIGVLGSLRNLLMLPWLVGIGFVIIFSFPIPPTAFWESGIISIVSGQLALIGFFLVSGWAGVAVRRTQRIGLVLGGLVVMSFVAATIIIVANSYIAFLSDPAHQGSGGLFGLADPETWPAPDGPQRFFWRETLSWATGTALVGTLLAAGTALGVGYFVRPFNTAQKKRPARSAFLEAAGGVFALIVVWYLAAGLVGVIASFFIPLGQTPPLIVRWLTTSGAYIASGLIVVPIVGRYLWKRYQQYARQA